MSITVHISGGLGNQMFQYAAGRALSAVHKTDLELDISSFLGDKNNREFMLDNYSIKARVLHTPHPLVHKVTSYMKSRLNISGSKRVYGEINNKFDRNVLKLPDNTYLLGHWQSEKYFRKFRDMIIAELTYRGNVSDYTKEMSDLLQRDQSVSLHIRRGDYVSDQKAARVLGVLPLSYYADAVALLHKQFKDLSVAVFTDDSAWVHKNVRIRAKSVHYVATGSACEDLELMKACRNHIIANSSYSWWGAWLNTYKKKTVIAPKKWFADPSFSAEDIVPQGWIRL